MTRFTNPYLLDTRRKIWDFILWKIGFYDDTTFKKPPPSHFSYPAQAQTFSPEKPSVMWIGHASFIITIEGKTILTDPVFSSHCSPIPLNIFKRKIDPPIALADLPPIDFVLISHNHYDHLDAKTVAHLKTFHPEIQWIIPKNLAPWFHRRNIFRVHELHWWEEVHFSPFRITAVPTQHFSGRMPWDKNKTGWNGYVLETKYKKLYFTGDTGYNAFDFKKIGTRWKGFDLSLIPIGTYLPRKFMQPVHICPFEAVQIHQDVCSRFSLGMHWKTFCLSEEPLDSPPHDLYLAMQQKKLPFTSFLPVDPGTYVNW